MALEFKPIALSDQKTFQPYLAKCPQVTSDYSFVNLWSWASAYGLEWAQADDFIWIRQNRPAPQYWAPIGDWQAADWPRYITQFQQFKSQMIRVPENLARLWASEFGADIAISEDRDQYDYLYDAEELMALSGNRFHKKRNLLNQFKKKYEYQYVAMTSELVDAALAMQANWCTWRECDSDAALANENQAIAKVLSHWDELDGIMGGCILVKGEMAAYAIGERMENMLVVHFEKGSTDYKGIYQAINQMFVEHATGASSGIRYVNREQDLGDAGLRRSKESYHPIEFLKKFQADFHLS